MTQKQRRRYELRDPQLDTAVEDLVGRVEPESGPRSESVRQMLVTALRLLRDGATQGDLKLLNHALKELRHAMRVFGPYGHVRKVAVFGSARTDPEHPEFRQARSFAERMAEQSWMIITGAGDGIMGAAQGGAGRHASFGVNIRLPFEQSANEVIAGDRKLINFRYFFTRKVTFVKEAHAIALFPGGFGTLDEGFETLTLIQTGKSEIMPVVFIDAPGGTYWKDWHAWVQTHLEERQLIGRDDTALYRITDDVDDAVAEITRFYRNYHSSRWVGEQLVLRVNHAPAPDQLAALSDEFADLVTRGGLELSGPLPAESGEVPELPRIVLAGDRRHVGRLRMLIDRLNDLVEPEVPIHEATPREIVALDFPAEAEQAEDDL